MNTETEYLKTIAEEIAANSVANSSDNKRANHHLEMEARRLEKSTIQSLQTIRNFAQRDTFHFNTLSKLVHICDILFDIDHSISADVQLVLELIANVKTILPNEIRPNIKLPKAFIVTQGKELAESWGFFEQEMHSQGVAPALIEIAAIPVKRFTLGNHRLYWRDFTWLKGYFSKLEMLDLEHSDCGSKSEALMSLLIGRDFNDDRYYVYCKKYVIGRVKAAGSKQNRLLELAACEKLVLQDTQIDIPSFDHRANPVGARLIKWIREEIDFVETHERRLPQKKFEFKWNVETIAFFYKLLWDHKVFGKVSLEPFSEQIAANCSSVGKDDFQPATIFSRFYVKDAEVVKTIEQLLSGMLADVRRFLE